MGNHLRTCNGQVGLDRSESFDDDRSPSESEFFQCYSLGDLIGRGTFGEVRACIALDDSTEYAVKLIDKKSEAMRTNSEYLKAKDEVTILENLRHPCIINLVDFYEGSRFLYVVLEKIDGGDLYMRLSQDMSQVFESDMASVAAQLLSAISYLHSLRIVHRDVKAENILLVDGSPARRDANIAETGGALGAIRLIDFGFACFTGTAQCVGIFSGASDNVPLSFVCGSSAYLAPEILEGAYGKKVDVWAAGVVVYLLFFAQYPYWSFTDPEETDRLICSGEPPEFVVHPSVSRDWQPSRAVTQFLARLFENDVSKRPDAKNAFMDPWVQRSGCEEDSRKLPMNANKLTMQLHHEFISQLSDLFA